MDFLIAAAYADGAAAAPQGGGFASFIPLIILIVVFYFLLIRPQQQKVKEHTNMVSALQKGDEVVTTGGLLGRITDIGENFIQIQVAQNTEVKVQRQAVAAVMPKGTMKNL